MQFLTDLADLARPHVHNISTANALLVWAAIYFVLRPSLNRAGKQAHLAALIAPHLFRYLGLITLLPHLFDVRALGFDDAYHAQIGFGDWTSGLLALLALALLGARSVLAIPAIWLFNIIGLADFLNAGLRLAPMISNPAVIGDLGWILLTFYLPMLVVSHIAIFVALLSPGRIFERGK